MSSRRALPVLLAGLSALASACHDGPTQPTQTQRYVLVTLRTLPGTGCTASDINDAGVAVGYCMSPGGAPLAVRWASGAMTVLGSLDGRSSSAAAINEAGDVVGWSHSAAGGRAALWRNDSVIDLGLVKGLDASYASDINDRGQIVGASEYLQYGTAHDPSHAVMWQDGVLSDLGPQLELHKVNDDGLTAGCLHAWWDNVVVCTRGVLWRDGHELQPGDSSLASPPDGWINVVGVNRDGLALGLATPYPYQPFLWDGRTVTRIDVPGATYIYDAVLAPVGRRMAACYSTDQSDYESSFLWDDGQVTDLGAIARAALGPGAAVGSHPYAINRHGVIAGAVLNDSLRSTPVLWVPLAR